MKSADQKSVLIVDNNERVLWILQEVLREAGFTVRKTWSGYQALELLKSNKFDVLLVDDYLPDLHASEFLQRVGNLPIQPWTIVMQRFAPTEQRWREYAELGACAIVRKKPDEIRQVVLSCCTEAPLPKTFVN